jgi:hypothetical protein
MSIGLICNLSKIRLASRAALKDQLTPVLITPVSAKVWSHIDTPPCHRIIPSDPVAFV